MWQSKMMLSLGVLAPSASDWGFAALGVTWSIFGIAYLVSCVACGLWIDRAGPRYSAFGAGVIYGSSHLVAAFGCYIHSLPLVWFGYGVIGATGCALGYVSPMIMLQKWFPDKKGLAAGVACSFYVVGGMATPILIDFLQRYFFKAPTYAGPASCVETKLEAGKRLVNFEGEWHEAVLATATNLAKVGQSHLQEGFYLVGTGDTGAMMALASLGSLWACLNFIGSWQARLPPEGWTPVGWSAQAGAATLSVGNGSVTVQEAMRTPQFYQLLVISGFSLAPGLFFMSSGHMIMSDIYGTLYPSIVTPTFLAVFVSNLNAIQVVGRLGIGVIADKMGFKTAYFLCCLSMPLCLLLPQLPQFVETTGVLPLYVFYASSGLILSCYGGTTALNAGYTADVFGPKYAGGIYSRVTAAWGVSALAAQSVVAALVTRSTNQSINALVAAVPPSAFEDAFKAPISSLPELIDSKDVTIARLMDIAPPGTVDPSVLLYDTTFYSLSSAVAVAALSNALLRKVDERHFEKQEDFPDDSLDALKGHKYSNKKS